MPFGRENFLLKSLRIGPWLTTFRASCRCLDPPSGHLPRGCRGQVPTRQPLSQLLAALRTGNALACGYAAACDGV